MVKPQQAVVLIDLILKNNCRKIVEVGVWKGHTCRYILREIGNKIDSYWAIDQWNVLKPTEKYGRMGALSYDDWTTMYKRLCLDMLWFPNLHVVRLSSDEVIDFMWDEYFDLVFIDADHYYDFVVKDVKMWISKVKRGGILCGHDYGNIHHPGVEKAVNEIFGSDNIELLESTVWMKKM
jgi:hypothetical protein